MSGKESGYLDMELLRFTTAGSVDDGKSTLIGRLLYDSKAIFEDQMEAIERASVGKGGEEVNLALLTDGLRAEREQGITIDVAYRYFATPKRKFIIADTPGHVQYTRNMVTGASTANAAVILVDARNGVIEQTRRHAYIAALLQIPHVIVCVNKMDLVDFDQERFEEIKADFSKVADRLGNKDVHYLPISAKLGDNVVEKSKNTDWYNGPTFIGLLENIPIEHDEDLSDPRFPVQYVIRPHAEKYHDYRGYAGRVAGGVFKVGQEVAVFPSGMKSKIAAIDFGGEEQQEAFPPQSVTIRLEDDIDISRGSMISDAKNQPQQGQEIELMVSWLSETPMALRKKYMLQHTSNEARCMVTEVIHKVNINTLEEITDDKSVGLNDIAKIRIKTTKPLFFDSYKRNRNTGSLILIDEATNNTVGAGMII
ncbi:sulfate adenylyltransferase subunit 1 [Prolixibacter denitrificans]|uniref:sulfate adenylyltransferase n=1 Tax=Prolixibacter denitrificans TaxID=1541063 RepID=A0A2P8CBG0_9BACT|nr:GTP-binding protein [Prolixibacter denitrificans]PSK82287.1 sulfate adenylyltransferase subunit 1 [Prolixibacter denitrificans]GET22964.1 sulfate adenylyltransferase subunit 1 [Prolixibacter denitrificans]